MSTFLMIDIGAGTMDVLHYDTETSLHVKAVAKSPVRYMAEKARDLPPGDLIITGKEMGGGAISRVLRERAQRSKVTMSVSAAATVHHDLERVRSMGFTVVDDQEADEMRKGRKRAHLDIRDVELERLRCIVDGLGVPFSFDVVGICAQDHGVPPKGVSHLDYRHEIFKKNLDEAPLPHLLLYENQEIPESLSRLRSIGMTARGLPTEEVYVMDSGMAAILGASMDPRARREERVLTIDIATSHTLGAALEGEEIAGFFEYHTADLDRSRVEQLLGKLAEGDLDHQQILTEGGHGAYVRKALGLESIETIVATGPKRALIRGSTLPVKPGAPLGDNMMTGTVGLLEAIRRRKELEPIDYS